MSPRVSKSKNLDKYPSFLPYDSPTDIPFNKIANKLEVHPNLLRGMMRSARAHSTIYTALMQMGYKDHQVPGWFARPDEPLVYRKTASAGPKVNAEQRSDAETHPQPILDYSKPVYVAQEKTAERPSALSPRSAPQATFYMPIQPVIQHPLDPLIAEANREIQSMLEKDMRARLNEKRLRRDPPKPVSSEVLKAQMEFLSTWNLNEARNVAMMMASFNAMNAGRAPEPLDVEELMALFTEPLKELWEPAQQRAKGKRGFVSALGGLIENSIPQVWPPDDFVERLEAIDERKIRNDEEAFNGLHKIMSENRTNKNIDLLSIEYQGKVIQDNFYKDMNRLFNK